MATAGTTQFHPTAPRRPEKIDAFRPIHSSTRLDHLLYMLVDLSLVCVNTLIVSWIRNLPSASVLWFSDWGRALHAAFGCPECLGVLPMYAALVALSMESQSLYEDKFQSSFREGVAIAKSVFFATVLLTACMYLLDMKTFSRLVIVIGGMVNAATLISWRVYRRHRVCRGLRVGRAGANILIVGHGPTGRAVADHISNHPELGYVVKGFIDQRNGSPEILGRLNDLEQVARAHFIDEVVITTSLDRNLIRQIVRSARRRRLHVKVVPELFDGLSAGFSIEHLGQIPVIALSRPPVPVLQLLLKRVIDMVGSAIALLALSPFVGLIAVAIKLDSPGPVFYGSLRVGRKGRIFRCYKFRTMVNEAERMQESLRDFNERRGVLFKISGDPRVTRVGRFLRKSSLDEVPQFWNVLRGDISLVGPRPALVGEFEQYSLAHLERLEVLPGITGLWQVTARQDPSFEKYLDLDRQYIANWNLWLDLEILLRTIPAVLRGTGE